MRKFLYVLTIMIIAVFTIKLISTNNVYKNPIESKEMLIKKSLITYYSKEVPKNTGDLKIYNIKNFYNDFLVLAEKYPGDGERFSQLFLLNENYDVIASTSGISPISMCFSANVFTYEKNTIIFGTFNDYKWDQVSDKKVPVDIKKIEVKFKDGKSIKEDVSIESGYIIFSDNNLNIEDILLYNQNDNIQSNLSEIGSINNSTLTLRKQKK